MVRRINRFTSTRAFLRYEISTLRLLAAFMLLWSLVYFVTPDALIANSYAREMVAKTSAVIGMIKVFATNSPQPERVAFFMTLQWLSLPFYVWASLARLSGNADIRVPGSEKLVLGVGALTFAVAPILLLTGPSDFTGTKMSAWLIRLQSSDFLSFMNSMLWPAFTAFFLIAGLVFICAPLRIDTRE